jgi:hypothetical protein
MGLRKRCEYCKHYDDDKENLCRDCKTGAYVKNKYDESYFEYNDELKVLLDKTQLEKKNKEIKRLTLQIAKIRKLVE